MPIAQLDDCELYYEEYGHGRPVLLIAGLGGVGSYWAPQIEQLSKHFRLIVHDHRGTGKSSRSKISYSIEQMAADTIGLMDALGIESADLVGHSTGGAIGQVLATERPERMGKIVMASCWTKADGFFRRCFEVRREILRASGPLAYVKATPVFLHPSWWIRDNIESIERAEEEVYGANPDVDIMDSRIDALLNFDWTDRLSEIEKEVLVLGVRNDHLTPAYYSEELAQRIPGAILKIMDEGGHASSQTLPTEFNEIVLNFLLDGANP